MPSFQICLPSGLLPPRRPQPLQVRHARHVHLGLRQRTGAAVSAPCSKVERNSPDGGHLGDRVPAGVVGADHHRDQLRLARRGRVDLAGQIGHPGARSRRSSSCASRRARGAQQPHGEARTTSVPVAQDTSGQSESTEQASKPRVMESPRAAIELGLRVPGGVRLAPAARRADVPAGRPSCRRSRRAQRGRGGEQTTPAAGGARRAAAGARSWCARSAHAVRVVRTRPSPHPACRADPHGCSPSG